jgi:hypothetical protein
VATAKRQRCLVIATEYVGCKIRGYKPVAHYCYSDRVFLETTKRDTIASFSRADNFCRDLRSKLFLNRSGEHGAFSSIGQRSGMTQDLKAKLTRAASVVPGF